MHMPKVVIQRPRKSEDAVRTTNDTEVIIDGFRVPCVTSLGVLAEVNSHWKVTITLNAGDVIFEDEK